MLRSLRLLRATRLLHGTLALGLLALAATGQDFAGTWAGEFPNPPDPQPIRIRIGLEETDPGRWHGGFDSKLFGTGLIVGEETREGLLLELDLGGEVHPILLSKGTEGGLRAELSYNEQPLAFDLERESYSWADELQLEVSLPEVRPRTVSLNGLSDSLRETIAGHVARSMDAGTIVGLALAVVVEGELVDSRAWGWSDVAAGRPVGADTLFRWASISKPVTAVTAVKLASTGQLELDRDVRALVPEFPEKRYVVTTRQLLGHLGGIVHYQHGPEVTHVDYGVEFPYRDPVRALDMFRAAPLIHEPGSDYSYSTHGYALVGAVIERSSEKGYLGEVRSLVSGPLGMQSFGPDDPAAPLPERTKGYRLCIDGRVFDAGDSNVAWKLAGGGFQSTVSDLGRFGAGLCDEEFLDAAQRELLWTRQTTSDGKQTGYGLGFNVTREDGRLFVVHGGAQRRTRTFLLCAPEDGLAVALMCNTEGSNLQDLGREIFRTLLP